VSTTKSLGLTACTAIVLGNMVGSGFYLAPAALAPFGQLAILAWIVMGAGAICLGLSFARLASLSPATGGPYAYTRIGFGDFMGFLIAWGYWISIWTSLPVVALAFAGAMMNMIPSWHGRTMALVLTLGSMWLMVGVNLLGVRVAGVFAQFTTATKMVPFIAIAVIGLLYIEPANLAEFNPSGQPTMSAFAALAPLTMFAYFGLESATVPAGDVKDAARTIPRATILGILIAAVLYVLATVVALGVVPREQLQGSVAPFVDVARHMWGQPGAVAVSFAVIVSTVGALIGWTLLMGQVPMAAAQDGLFPAVFGKVSARGVPAIGVVISALLATALVLVQAAGSPGVQKFYNMIVSLSTMTAAIPYAFCAAAVGLVAARTRGGPVPRATVVDLIAFLFAIFTIYGCGPQPVLYGLLLLLLGIPVFVWLRRRASREAGAAPAA
jgi:APA family basic amino acid/polyamine antiporter